jgi:hypothetical protein
MKKSIPKDGIFTTVAAFLNKCFRSTNKGTDVDTSTTTSEVTKYSSKEPNDLSNDKAHNTTQDTDVANIDVKDVDAKTATFEVTQASSSEPNKPNNLTNEKVYNMRNSSTQDNDVIDIDAEDKTIVKTLHVSRSNASNRSDTNLRNYINGIISHVDLYSPPGIAGEICRELELYEHRPIKELRPLVALSSLSMTNHNRNGFGGGNLNFQALAIASSAAGKEAHMNFNKLLLEGIGLADKIVSKPRSDKSIYLDIIEAEYLLYSFDEAHSFFKQASNKNAAAFETGMVSVLLEVCTSEKFYLPSKIRDELLQKQESIICRLSDKSVLSVKEEALLNKSNRLVDRLENGWKDPFLSLVGYSTPINLDIMINEHNIEQGLIGRFIILRAPERREKMTWRKIDGPSSELISRLRLILASECKISIEPMAKETLNRVFNFFELNEHLNHPKLGAIYARGTKWVMLIASLLASESNLITHEHICYATKLFMYNIQSCEAVLYGESDLEEALLSKAKELALRYASEQGIGRGALASKMVNCCTEIAHYRRKKKNICHVLIDQLIDDGVIVQYGSMIQIAA